MHRVDPRVKKNNDGLLVLADLLRNIALEPQSYADDAVLLETLKDQKRTAALEYEFKLDGKKRATHKMSINTLKSYAGRLLDDGFEGFERLRIGAYDAIIAYKEREDEPNRRTKTGLAKTVDTLEEQLEAQRKVNFILLQAVSAAMHSIKIVRDGDKPALRKKHADDAMERLRAILSLNPHPFKQPVDNVVSIDEFRGHNDKE